jgi:hypothetical protein
VGSWHTETYGSLEVQKNIKDEAKQEQKKMAYEKLRHPAIVFLLSSLDS